MAGRVTLAGSIREEGGRPGPALVGAACGVKTDGIGGCGCAVIWDGVEGWY